MAELKKLETEKKEATKAPAEPTYEQLKDWCDQLMIQRNQLAQRLNQVTNVTNKLPWLFEVIKTRDFFTPEFVDSCASEIEFIMTPQKEEEKEESKD